MSDPTTPQGNPATQGSPDEHSVLFAQLVLQQTNMAMMLLGKTGHPETGETVKDVEAAKLFIDQLGMLEAKTKGNLSPQETNLLKQNLVALRLAFVEAVDSSTPAKPPESKPPPAGEASKPPSPPEESHKKFSKKY
jgi:Domain of unknown function (DUF1844)